MELRLDRCQVGKDVGMVELEVVEDRGAREVVDELAALVEERGVVLVGLDDKQRRRPRAGATEPGRHAEVLRHAANQEAGRQPRMVEDAGQHRRGRGLAMGAGHRQHMTAAQQVLADPLWPRNEARAAFENRFHQRIAARDHIADHEQVRRQR